MNNQLKKAILTCCSCLFLSHLPANTNRFTSRTSFCPIPPPMGCLSSHLAVCTHKTLLLHVPSSFLGCLCPQANHHPHSTSAGTDVHVRTACLHSTSALHRTRLWSICSTNNKEHVSIVQSVTDYSLRATYLTKFRSLSTLKLGIVFLTTK